MATDVITTLSDQPSPDVVEKRRLISFIRDVDEGVDKPSAWFVCVCCSFASMINLGSSYTYGLFFPSILGEFQAGKSVTALVGSLTVACAGLLGPATSKLCKRFGCRMTMISGGLISAVALFGSSFAPNIYVLVLTYGLSLGFGSSLIYLAAFQIIPLYFHRHRSLATAMVSAGPGAGLLLMSPVVQTLLEHFDWRKAFMVLAAANLATCFLGCSIRRKNVTRVENEEDLKQNKKSIGCYKCATLIDTSALKNPRFMLLCLAATVCCLGYIMPSIHLAKYAEDLGIPISHSSWMYFTIGIASVVSRILTGKLCDTGWISLIHIFQIGAVLFGIADLLLPMVTSFKYFMTYSVTYGICEGLFTTPMHCLMLASFPGVGFGWYLSFLSIGVLIGPALAGLIADLSGSYHPAFITAGVLFFVSACLPFLFKYIHKSDKPEEIKLNVKIDEELEIFEKMTVL